MDDLRKRHLKIAQFEDLNDPFELRAVNLCDRTHAMAFDGVGGHEGFKAQVSNRFGVLCFSESKFDVLQWAHYADRHKGICLGFDVSIGREKFGPVDYRSMKFPFPKKPDEKFILKLLRTKSKVWAYEREWRVFLELKEGVWNESAGRVLYFADFGPELILKEVILGAATVTVPSEVTQAMHGYAETIRVSRMRLSCHRFELEEHALEA